MCFHWIFSAEFAVEGDKPLQLRDLAEMLRKTAEPQTVVKALGLLAPLIEAAPDELANYSGVVLRTQHPRYGLTIARQRRPACLPALDCGPRLRSMRQRRARMPTSFFWASAAEMARSLLYCSLPEWADSEAAEDENKPSVQRLRYPTH